MKMAMLLAAYCLTFTTLVFAQSPATIRVKGSEAEIARSIPVSIKYLYSNFITGNVSYINNMVSNGRLNYNLLLGEVHFIDSKGDTLSVDNELSIRQITIGKDTFYFDSQYRYLEVIANYNTAKLARNQRLKQLRVEKEGAYGQSTAVSSIKNVNVYTTQNGQVYKLTPKGDIVFAKELTYFFIDHNKRFYKASKSKLLKVFSKYKRSIEQYLEEQPVDFNKEEDLKRLLQFCSELS